MKLQVQHSGLYLSTDAQGKAIQSSTPKEWEFLTCSQKNNSTLFPSTSEFGRIILKEPMNPSQNGQCLCLSPPHIYPTDGVSICLSPIQVDDATQLWRFREEGNGYFTIEHHTRRVENHDITITNSCMNVCCGYIHNGAYIIAYHASHNAQNQRSKNELWMVVALP